MRFTIVLIFFLNGPIFLITVGDWDSKGGGGAKKRQLLLPTRRWRILDGRFGTGSNFEVETWKIGGPWSKLGYRLFDRKKKWAERLGHSRVPSHDASLFTAYIIPVPCICPCFCQQASRWETVFYKPTYRVRCINLNRHAHVSVFPAISTNSCSF